MRRPGLKQLCTTADTQSVWLFLEIVLVPLVCAFYIIDSFRMQAVRGTILRYKLTGIMWALVVPSYAYACMLMARGLTQQKVYLIAIACFHFVFITIGYRRLKRDDDDNPWRRLKNKIKSSVKAAVKRAQQVRMPHLAPPVGAES